MSWKSTTSNKRENAAAEPLDNQMWERERFDRRGIRREFAEPQALSLDDKHITQDDQTYVDPRSIEMPAGPSAMGDFGGKGVRMFDIEGDRWPTFRWTQGFEVLEEDSDDVEQQRNAVLELFDYFADVAFLTGIGPNSHYAEGMFDWLRDSIPSDRTFDLSDGQYDEHEDRPENIIHKEALQEVDGRLMNLETANWSLMVGSQEVLSLFNQVRDVDGTGTLGDTYFEALMDEDNAMGGIEDWNLIPESISPAKVPYTGGEDSEKMFDELTVDLVDNQTAVKDGGADEDGVIGTDEVFLLPDMDVAANKLWRTYEQENAAHFRVEERGGKEAHDYAWRYTHRFNPARRHPNATDCIHIQNVSELFD